jgi:hypothetical protein
MISMLVKLCEGLKLPKRRGSARAKDQTSGKSRNRRLPWDQLMRCAVLSIRRKGRARLFRPNAPKRFSVHLDLALIVNTTLLV